MHKPIQCTDLGLSFPHKTCFANFNGQIAYGDRIAIIGRNGSGKSTLLKLLQGQRFDLIDGEIVLPPNLRIGYVPQIVDDWDSLSGGERLNQALTQALVCDPDLLLLDEPTNHLDRKNRRSLMRLLQQYQGALVVVSHDVELLQQTVEIFWHIEAGEIHVFSGRYDDYLRERLHQKAVIETEVSRLNWQKQQMHNALMQEQSRAAKSRSAGKKHIENRRWPTVTSAANVNRAVETSGRKKAAIHQQKQELTAQLAQLRQPESITPNFNLPACHSNQTLITIAGGGVGYADSALVLEQISLHLSGNARVALLGDNGSGKSTLIKAILRDAKVIRHGEWFVPQSETIGYLDQHYQNLDPQDTVLEAVAKQFDYREHRMIRKHLNDFLFRKNEEVEATVADLSGGEKARLSLCCIAAKPPKLLILDEITNNLDLETREHVIEVIREYPGALLVISHDVDFLRSVSIQAYYQIQQGTLEYLAEGL